MKVITTTEHHVRWKSPEDESYEVGVDSSNLLYIAIESAYLFMEPSEIDRVVTALNLIKEKITNG